MEHRIGRRTDGVLTEPLRAAQTGPMGAASGGLADVATPLPSPSLLLRGAAGYIARHGFSADHWAEPGERAGVLGAISIALAHFELVGPGEGAARFAPSVAAFTAAGQAFARHLADWDGSEDGWAGAIDRYEGRVSCPPAWSLCPVDVAVEADLLWAAAEAEGGDALDDEPASFRDLVHEAEAHDRADDLRAWRAGR